MSLMRGSFYSKPREQTADIKWWCFFKTLGSPSGSKACSAHTAVAIQSCLHHTGVCPCEKAPSWTKDWTTVCRLGLLTKTTFQHSAVSPFSLAFRSNIYSSSRSTNRGSSALACCNISISAITWWRRVTLAFTFVPGASRHHPNARLCKSVHKTLSMKHQPAQHWLITMCWPPEPRHVTCIILSLHFLD